MYYDILKFLDSYEPTDVEESLSQPSTSRGMFSQAQSPEDIETHEHIDTDMHTESMRLHDTDGAGSVTSEDTRTLHRKRQTTKTKPTEFEGELLQLLKADHLELEEDDLAFFKSLQPTLKKFTTYQKLMFRTKVMNALMEIEYQNFLPPNSAQDMAPTPTTSYSDQTDLDFEHL